MLQQTKEYIATHNLLPTGATVVVGVSGGPDSVALLHLLRRLAAPLDLTLHVAHLHHGIRGADADADAAFIAELAADWGLPCTVEQVDLPAIAEREGLAIEEAARRVRYAFLCRAAGDVGARIIAVGHNADDQAETVLMHLLRGAGPAGLRGMLPKTRLQNYRLLPQIETPQPDNMHLIRPLLGTSRADIEAYCERHDLSPRFDRSNLDTTFFRNQLRHEVLPYLAKINPGISERLQHLAEIVRADYNLMQEFISIAWDTLLVKAHPDALVFDLRGWREQPLATRRSLIRRAAFELRRTLRDVDFGHVENAVRIVQTGETGAQATLPQGLELRVGYETLTIADQDALHLPPEAPWLADEMRVELPVPGKVHLPEDWSVRTRYASYWNLEIIAENVNPFVAWLDADAVGDAPYLRTRREGDRFQPHGMGGDSMRLSDFLINQKAPLRWRDYLPLLVADGKILWVVGMRLDESALVRPETERVVYVRFRGPG